MHKRSLLVGFGLGLLLAGFLGMMFGGWGHGWDRGYAPTTTESIRSSESAAQANAQYYTMRGSHHFWGFPFMLFFCVGPLLFFMFMGGMFRMFRRMHWRRRMWRHGWGHPMHGFGHHHHHMGNGEPPTYV